MTATREVRFETIVRAEREKVYDAIATAAGLDGWFTDGTELDATPGGPLIFRWTDWGVERFTGELDKIRFHKREGDFDKALSLVNNILEKEQEFPEALYLKAQILWEGFGNRSAAVSYLEKTMHLAGEGEPLYRWASGYLSEMDDHENA